MLSRSTRTEWDAIISRVLREEIAFRQMIAEAVRAVVGGPEIQVRIPLSDCIESTFEAVRDDPAFEPLSQRDQGRLAARIFLCCVRKRSAIDLGLNEGIRNEADRGQVVIRHIREGLPNMGREFKEGFVEEVKASATPTHTETR
ncbi:MAG: hypothetical protein OXF01_06930 [Gemmatimonadetes bacterium]|nr:hypothetical protein [Gemmatimonadota bacterium]